MKKVILKKPTKKAGKAILYGEPIGGKCSCGA